MSHHNQIPIRVLHENLSLATLPVACPTPYLPGSEINRPAPIRQCLKHWGEILKIDLKHDPLAKRVVQRPGFKATMPLAKHDLMSFGMLQVGKSFFRSFKSCLKAQNVLPEREASLKVIHMKLDDYTRPTTSRGPSINFALCPIIHLDL
jgi:hypothetical protein